MTREEWAKLSPEEQRIRVAELCGWVRSGVMRLWIRPSDKRVLPSDEIPDYLNDLNACHEFEETLDSRYEKYIAHLQGLEVAPVIPLSIWDLVHATAAQRAEAFVLTMEGE